MSEGKRFCAYCGSRLSQPSPRSRSVTSRSRAPQAKAVSKLHYASYFQWVLETLQRLGGSALAHAVVEEVATIVKASEGVLPERFYHHVHSARFYLAQAGYITGPRGVWTLTDRAVQALPLSTEDARNILYQHWARHMEAHVN
jgi:hypothetical protein